MTRTRKFLLGGLAVAAVVGGVAAAAAHRHGAGWGHGHGGHGWHRAQAGPFGMLAGGGRMCGGRAAEMADVMAVRLEHRLKITEAQKPVLDDLKAAMRSGAAKIESACPPRPEPSADGTRPPRPTPPERLARMETALAARLEALRTVRPAADRLYATLSEEQKQTLSAMGPGGRRGWHRGHMGPKGMDPEGMDPEGMGPGGMDRDGERPRGPGRPNQSP